MEFLFRQAQEQLQAEVLRYKAKIEDLEATLAQKGQVGIWLLALLQMQTIQSDLSLAHLCMGRTQDTAWLSTVIFLKLR